jgi:hypothetical protein
MRGYLDEEDENTVFQMVTQVAGMEVGYSFDFLLQPSLLSW